MSCTVMAALSKETIARLQFKAEFSWSLLLCAGLVFCNTEIIVFFPDDCVLNLKYYTGLQKGIFGSETQRLSRRGSASNPLILHSPSPRALPALCFLQGDVLG